MQLASSEHPWRASSAAVFTGYARAFGEQPEDIDVDFTRQSRPELVSALLSRCLYPPQAVAADAEDVWSWSLGQRLQGLIAVAHASALSRFGVVQPCASCGERLEISIDANDFAREEPVIDFDWLPPSATRLSLRLPTGHDQRRWLRGMDLGAGALARELVEAIDGVRPPDDWQMPDDWIDEVAAALERHDPLTALELDARCPACEASVSIELDLEGKLLEQFRARQCRRLREIHLLASRYHWAETEILKLPAWRRHYYLAALGMEGDA